MFSLFNCKFIGNQVMVIIEIYELNYNDLL